MVITGLAQRFLVEIRQSQTGHMAIGHIRLHLAAVFQTDTNGSHIGRRIQKCMLTNIVIRCIAGITGIDRFGGHGYFGGFYIYANITHPQSNAYAVDRAIGIPIVTVTAAEQRQTCQCRRISRTKCGTGKSPFCQFNLLPGLSGVC